MLASSGDIETKHEPGNVSRFATSSRETGAGRGGQPMR